jgi:hypothetical protein
MSAVRIVERTHPGGRVEYLIQVPHWLFRWMWVDPWVNEESAYSAKTSFRSLEEAKENLWMFDGSEPIDKIILER